MSIVPALFFAMFIATFIVVLVEARDDPPDWWNN